MVQWLWLWLWLWLQLRLRLRVRVRVRVRVSPTAHCCSYCHRATHSRRQASHSVIPSSMSSTTSVWDVVPHGQGVPDRLGLRVSRALHRQSFYLPPLWAYDIVPRWQ